MGVLGRVTRLLRWADRRHGPRDMAKTMSGLRRWQATPLADAILNDEKQQLDKLLAELFGYHLLEMSCFDVAELSAGSRINHRFRLSPVTGGRTAALVDFGQLPLPSESIDVVLLHHVLDYATQPHQVLREANRVLISSGYLIITGFNPWSPQGLYKVVAQWLGAGDFWRRRGLRAARVVDWLHLLDCEPVNIEHGFYRLPVNHAGVLKRFEFWERLCRRWHLPFGGYYVVLARKDRVAMTPIKPVWSSMNPMAGLALGKPAARMPESVGCGSKSSKTSDSGERG